ncbi:hypothetical protein Tco_0884082 [Tanacetum coccineum]
MRIKRMASQPQRQVDVHPDELCPPNKLHALIDANKKIDLDNPLRPNESKNESKIMANILQNHPLRFNIVASSSYNHRSTWGNHADMYCFVNNVYVDYVELLWEGLHYALEHPLTLIPYPRFTKLIVGYYMTAYPKISRRVRDKYHNLEHDEMVKSIFNSGKNKAGVGMKISYGWITNRCSLRRIIGCMLKLLG